MTAFRLLALLSFISLVARAEGAEPSFTRQTIDSEIQIGYGLAVGRVDEDQHPDLLLADKSEIVWYENPGGSGNQWAKHVIARNLTPRDNVCLAARDIDGDGLVEIAVGANWNPGETTDASSSGSLFYLTRPDDPRKVWKSAPITPHEPTTHRMHWINGDAGYQLAVLPLHGVGNKGGTGQPVHIEVYDVEGGQTRLDEKLKTEMHMTHNFDVVTHDDHEVMLLGGKEGLVAITTDGQLTKVINSPQSKGVGEIRRYPDARPAMVAIEPMHGTDVALYRLQEEGTWSKQVLDASLSAGHALAVGDLCGDETAEIVAGWRGNRASDNVGIKVYAQDRGAWTTHVLDDNQIACEDVKLADLNGDGKLDVIGAGRRTKNVVVYWNESE